MHKHLVIIIALCLPLFGHAVEENEPSPVPLDFLLEKESTGEPYEEIDLNESPENSGSTNSSQSYPSEPEEPVDTYSNNQTETENNAASGVLSLLTPFINPEKIEAFRQHFDYSTPERKRTPLQQGIRSVRKWYTNLGGRDAIGLGTEQERATTIEIYKKIEYNLHDETTIHQFLDRQRIATNMAFTLIRELQQIQKNPKLDATNLARILSLIEDAKNLCEINDEYVLSPVVSQQLKVATNTVKENVRPGCQDILAKNGGKEDQQLALAQSIACLDNSGSK